MSKVYLFLADGFETVEALAPADVMRRAGIEVVTVSIMGRQNVVSAQNVPVVADALYEDICFCDADGLVLPGGGTSAATASANTLPLSFLQQFIGYFFGIVRHGGLISF